MKRKTLNVYCKSNQRERNYRRGRWLHVVQLETVRNCEKSAWVLLAFCQEADSLDDHLQTTYFFSSKHQGVWGRSKLARTVRREIDGKRKLLIANYGLCQSCRQTLHRGICTFYQRNHTILHSLAYFHNVLALFQQQSSGPGYESVDTFHI